MPSLVRSCRFLLWASMSIWYTFSFRELLGLYAQGLGHSFAGMYLTGKEADFLGFMGSRWACGFWVNSAELMDLWFLGVGCWVLGDLGTRGLLPWRAD